MAALTFPNAGNLKVMAFRRLPNERGGQAKRVLSGQLRGDPLWQVRAWQAEVLCETDAEADSVYLDADGFTDRSLTGDLLPAGGVTARVDVSDDGHTLDHDRETWVRKLTLQIREQP